ncbi:MAG TPA: HAMP domain-containing sensor histidine kinase [Azospirillaceae bacterium]|nr:HAMP domain-containing sensor histidine kinase [Azospirillaceae bacterium]
MVLEAPTLFVVTAAVAGAIAFIFAAFARLRREVPGFSWWVWSGAVSFLGICILFARGAIPMGVSVGLGNGVLLAGALMTWAGVRRFNGAERVAWVVPALSVAAVTLVLPLLQRTPSDFHLRTFLASGSLAVVYAFLAVEMFRRGPRPFRPSAVVATAGFVLLALSLGTRSLSGLAAVGTPDLFQPTQLQGVLIMANVAFMVVHSVGLILMAMDRLQEKLQRTAEALRLALDDRDAARQRAEEANLTRSTYFSLLGHELRTPLQAVIGYAELIQVTAEDQDAPHLPHVETIRQSGRHMLSIVEGILTLAKAETGLLEIDPGEVDLAGAAAFAAGMVAPAAEARGVRVGVAVPPGRLVAAADGQAIRQVLLNLVANAVKFAAPGGTVSVAARDDGNGGIEVAVEDDGPGIDLARVPTLLRPFQRADNRYRSAAGGTGLGLPLSAVLLSLHGTELRFAHAEPRGTRVSFTLKAVPAAAPAVATQ